MTALGNVVGSYLLAAAVAFGIGSLVERSLTVFLVVKLAGAAYLVLLGVRAFRHRKEMKASALRQEPAAAARGDLRTVLDGALVGLTNRSYSVSRSESWTHCPSLRASRTVLGALVARVLSLFLIRAGGS